MLRRILIIILVAVVIIAAFFAIRAFLNRDSGEADAPDGEPTAVVDESGTSTEEGAVDEAPITEETDAGEQTTDAPVGSEESTDSYPPPVAEGGEGAPTEGNVETAPVEEGTTTEGDSALGGDASSGDTDAGGGVPAEAGEADSNLGETVAVEPSEGSTGGQGDTPAISQPIAFVQPGVPTQHNVANDEWLTQLARCYGTTVADIQAANNYACPDLIHAGWVVNISNPGNAGPITINDTPCFYYHTIQQGETLYSIATQYGIDYQWLARINAIYNYDYVYAGQQLVIPNPVDPVFTQPPAEPFYYSNCWYNYCPGWEYPPVAVPYTQ